MLIFLPPFAVPSWGQIAPAFLKLRLDYIAVTILQVVGAMAMSFLVGLGIAILMYRFNAIERYGMPIIRLLMAIPVVCWVVFAILWFKEDSNSAFSLSCSLSAAPCS